MNNKEDLSVWTLLNLAWELGYIVIIPIVLLGAAGAYADKKLNTLPLFVIIGFVLSMIIAGVSIYRKIKEINEISDPKTKNDKQNEEIPNLKNPNSK